MTEREAQIALNLVGGIGTARLGCLLRCFGSAAGILSVAATELSRVSGIGDKLAGRIAAFETEDLRQELSLAARCGVRIILRADPEYPVNLKTIPDPPPVLYVKGNLSRQDDLACAIVGSRRASLYGLTNARGLAAELARLGFTVVSGLARGIDTAAHQGALKAKGRTIAVVGSGLSKIYPAENRGLADAIAEAGAVISEFPLNAEPLKQNFPQRNRVISGLSLGVLVAEAAVNSGALITADFALEQGREVFALPGRIDSPQSLGANKLIQQGAKLVAGVGDILEEIAAPFLAVAGCRPEATASGPQMDFVDSDEALLYNLILKEAIPLEEIIQRCDLNIPRLSRALLGLELKKRIRQLPGKSFIRA